MKKAISIIIIMLLVLTLNPVFADDSAQANNEAELKVVEIDEGTNGAAFITIVEEYPQQAEVPKDTTEDLTPKEVRRLDTDEISSLSPDQMEDLSTKQVEGLETEQIQQMDPEQIEQIDQMAPEQIDQTLADQTAEDVAFMQEELPADIEIQEPETMPKSDEHIITLDTASSDVSVLSVVKSYFTTPSYAASSNKVRNGRKTVYYKNGAGKIMWSVTVHGKFSYKKGKNSTCTSAAAISSAPSKAWKMSSSYAYRSGNHGTAVGTAKRYFGRFVVERKSRSVTLYCNSQGTLY